MKLLLTSVGITNASIHKALLDLLGKPIAECHALCIPSAGAATDIHEVLVVGNR